MFGLFIDERNYGKMSPKFYVWKSQWIKHIN